MLRLGKLSLRLRHGWQSFRMLVVRSPWKIAFGTFSFFGVIEYLASVGLSFAPGILVIGLILLVFNCYSWALLVRPLRAVRPPAFLVRAGRACCLVGLVIWAASVLFAIEVTVAPYDRWTLCDAFLKREDHAGRKAHLSGSPVLRVRLQPTPFVINTGGSECGGGCRQYWPTCWLAISSGLPTLVLAQLRRERIGLLHCRKCEYDLTGNVSGVCPECGTRFPAFVLSQAREGGQP